MKRVHAAILIVTLMLLSLELTAQQFRFNKFSLEEGLPQSQVYDVLQDSRGFLWMGTWGGGLSRFDGTEFVTFQSKDGLGNNFINCLYEDPELNIWIGTKKGLVKYDGQTFSQIRQSNNQPAQIFEIRFWRGKLWVAAEQGMYQLQADSLVQIPILPEDNFFQVTSITPYQDALALGSNRGLILLGEDGKQIEHIKLSSFSPDNYIQSLLNIGDSTLVIGTYGRGLSYFEKGEISKERRLSSSLIVYDLCLDDDDNLWIATQRSGAIRFRRNDRTALNFNKLNGLSSNQVRCVLNDRWGQIWLGTSGGGLNQFAGQNFIHFTTDHGLMDNYIYSCFEDRSGRLWFGSGSKGVMLYDSNRFTNYGLDSGFANVKVRAIEQTRDGLIWFGTEGNGLSVFNGDTIFSYTTEHGLAGNYIKDLEIGEHNELWIATLDGGLSSRSLGKGKYRGMFRNYQYLSELPTNRINALQYHKGKLWFGTENKGVGFIQKTKVSLPISAERINYSTVRAIRSQSDSTVLLATSSGLYSYLWTQDSLVEIQNEAMRSSNIYLMEFDQNGDLFIGHEKGVDLLKFNDAGELIDLENYGHKEGFKGIETCQNAVCRDRDGRMWFGTINGLTRYQEETESEQKNAPLIHLDRIELFNQPLDSLLKLNSGDNWDLWNSSSTFEHTSNNFSFYFKLLDLGQSSDVLYKWRLVGADERWNEALNKTNVTYPNLIPGSYTFELMAKGNSELWSDVKRWNFEIRPPFWQTNWFKIGMIILGVLMVFFIFWGITRRIKQREKEKRNKIELEKEMLELEQKALQLQMNPHFLFNVLNSIQSRVAFEEVDLARNSLQQFAKLMRLMLNNSRSKLISLENEIDALRLYLQLEQDTKEEPFEFSISLQEGVDSSDIYIPPMMIQPFVENAIIHGLNERGKEGQLQVTFSMSDEVLHCAIEDNGIGRKAAIAKRSSKGHTSTAMDVIEDRINAFNAEGNDNRLEVTDLEKDGQAIGTRVDMFLSIS